MLEENKQFEISGEGHYQYCCHLGGAQGHHSPQKPSQPLQRIKWSYNPIIRDILLIHNMLLGTDPSAEQEKPLEKLLCSACWSPSELAGIALLGEGTSLRARKPNQSPSKPSGLSSTFLDTASCTPHLTHVPRWSQLLQAWWQEASVGDCIALCKDLLAKCSLGGSQNCSRPALLLREGK